MLDRDVLMRALSKERAAIDAFVARCSPIIEARVSRILFRRAAGRDIRAELFDTTQDVFLHLFDRDAYVLRSWDPERGLSLDNFVGLVAERVCASRLRTKKTDPFRDTPTELEALESALGEGQMESQIVSRDLGEALLILLRSELSPKGLDLFYRIFLEDQDVEQIVADTGLSRDAVYTWKARLQKTVSAHAKKLTAVSDSSSTPQTPRKAND